MRRTANSTPTARPPASETSSSVRDKVGIQIINPSCDWPSHVFLGGWHPESGDAGNMPREINAQIDQAFKNVDLALKTAGGKGWSQVYRVNSYHVPLNKEANDAMVRNFRKWCPNHQPLFTCVGVQRLGEDDMRVEIEVRAYDPEGAKAAAEKS